MNNPRFNKAVELLDRFEKQPSLAGQEAETLMAAILRACGHKVRNTGFVTGDRGVDCLFEAELEGRYQLIGVEIKVHQRPVDIAPLVGAMNMQASGHLDRMMVISRSGFTRDALARADSLAAGKVDLLSPADLRNWLEKHVSADSVDLNAVNIIREAMKQLALRLAEHPEELVTIEWRQLEQVLREVFEGLGFETRLTRPGRDGGFDLELTIDSPQGAERHLVEVKHWTEQRPGAAHLSKLIKVTAGQAAAGALLLSTSGFAGTIYSGLMEFSAPVRLADAKKVISLCRAFHRFSTGIWLPDQDLSGTLYQDTYALGQNYGRDIGAAG